MCCYDGFHNVSAGLRTDVHGSISLGKALLFVNSFLELKMMERSELFSRGNSKNQPSAAVRIRTGGDQYRSQLIRDMAIASCVGLCAFALYLYSLLPTVGYIDSPIYTKKAFFLTLGIRSIDHPLFMIIGRLFTLLPLGSNIAYRVNLVSAFFGAVTVFLLYLSLRVLRSSHSASVVAALVFATSHIFWWLSTEAEVYTLNTAFLAAILLLAARFNVYRSWNSLCAACYLLGLSLVNHQLMVLLLFPLLLFLLTHRAPIFRSRRSTAKGIQLVLIFLLGFSPFLILLAGSIIHNGAGTTVNHATGGDFSKYLFAVRNPREFFFVISSFTVITLSQFHLFIFPVLWGIRGAFRKDTAYPLLLVAYIAIHAIFVINYQVPDRPFFYLPVFLVLALFLGRGIDTSFTWLRNRCKSERYVTALIAIYILLILLRPVQHNFTMHLINDRIGKERLNGKLERFRHDNFLLFLPHIPGRDDIVYYLNPVKRHNFSAEYYLDVITSAPPRAIIVDDWYHGYSIMKDYYQDVGGIRKDIEYIRWFVKFGGTPEEQMKLLDRILAAAEKDRNIFLTSREYPVSALLDSLTVRGISFTLTGEGLLHRLEIDERELNG
jgi:hypothetical protein